MVDYSQALRLIRAGKIPAILDYAHSRAFSNLADYRREFATCSKSETKAIFAKYAPDSESLRAHARAASWLDSPGETARSGASWRRCGGGFRRVELLATPYAIEQREGVWYVFHETGDDAPRDTFLGQFVSQGHAKRGLLKAIALGEDPERVRPDALRAEFIGA